jgi:hypothetical protein
MNRTTLRLMILLSMAGVLAAQDSGARLIAIFPYGDAEGSLKREEAFARYAIPDMLRVDIAERGRFSLVEKAAVDAALSASGGESGEGGASQETLAAAARALGADHYIWGYIGSMGDGLAVFHNLVETESGKTLHAAFARLPSGQGVFDAAEASIHEFSAWINADLPERAPEIVYVEKEVIVERPASPPPKAAPGGLAIGADFSYRFFVFEFADWLRPAPRAGLSLDLAEDRKGSRLGFLIETSPLFQDEGSVMDLDGITIIQFSLYARASFALGIARGLEARLGAMAGTGFFAGYVPPDVIAYFRPSLAIEANVEYRPTQRLGIGLGARAEATFFAWQANHMLEIAPAIYVRYLP